MIHRLIPFVLLAVVTNAAAAKAPNVVLVITDDQGYGDVAAHGNSMIKTPNLDRLHSQSVRLTNFHVDPTCSPTRSALMSGRYSTRTGVWHTIQGRSLMSPNEVTLAEVLAAGGYRTGMYGKWHLGDNFPCRPQDQGFQKTWHHGGGGITQTPDWWGNDYFDDTYTDENGKAEQFTGYCTDVWFDKALEFIEQSKSGDKPFFCYLATNAPHGPFNVAKEYSQPYVDAGVPERMALFYGMITNIDDNMGRLTARLDEWGIAEETILIFMTDNGTAAGVARPPRNQRDRTAQTPWAGFNDEMRGQKGSEYDGGHRVPFFIRWPGGGLEGGRDVDQLAAHVDVMPTLLQLCGVKRESGPPTDGASLVSVLNGDDEALRDRTLFVHSQRLEHVVKWRKSAVMTDRWRLVNGKELYDIRADHSQNSDVASANPEVVQRLTAAYESWWKSLSPVFDDYVRITLGDDAENPVRLTCHDWHTGDKPVPWNQRAVSNDPTHNGWWAVRVQAPGRYRFRLRMRPGGVTYDLPAGTAQLQIAEIDRTQPVNEGSLYADFEAELKPGDYRLQTELVAEDGKKRGAYFVDVRRLD